MSRMYYIKTGQVPILLWLATTFFTGAAGTEEKPLRVPVRLVAPTGAESRPILAGGSVAFPKGAVKSGRLVLLADGKPWPASITARALWPDGSVMVAGIDTFIAAGAAASKWTVAVQEQEPAFQEIDRATFSIEGEGGSRAASVSVGGHIFRVPAEGAAPFLSIDGAYAGGAFASMTVLSKKGGLGRQSTANAGAFSGARAYAPPDGFSIEIVRKGYMRAAAGGFDFPGEPMLISTFGGRGGSTPCGIIAGTRDALHYYDVSAGFTDKPAATVDGPLTCAAVDLTTNSVIYAEAAEGGALLKRFAVSPGPASPDVKLPFAPQRLSVFKGTAVTVDAEGNVTALELATGKALWKARPPGQIFDLVAAAGIALVLVLEDGSRRAYAYGLADGKDVAKTTYWDFQPPYAISPNARYLAHRKGDGYVIVDALTGDLVSGGKVAPIAMGFSPSGRLFAFQTPKTPDVGMARPPVETSGAIVVVATTEEKMLFAQEMAEGFRAERIAIDEQARVLAAQGGGVLCVADTGAYPYRTVYRFRAGVPAVEIEHALFLDGDPDAEFLASAELAMAAPATASPPVRVLAPPASSQPAGVVYRDGSNSIFVADADLRMRQPRGIRAENGLIVYELYPAALRRPLDLRRYAMHVFTDHLYDESPGWGSRSAQGAALFASFIVGFVEDGKEPVRGWFVTEPAAAAASGVWGEFIPSETAAQKFPILSRFCERLFATATHAAGRDAFCLDYGDFPGSPLLGDFLFQGRHGWRNGEEGVLQALVAQFIFKPDMRRFELMQNAARHLYTVDMVRFADGKGDYWRTSAEAVGTVRSAGSQHWSGRAGDVKCIGNAAGLLDYYLLTGDRLAREAAEDAIEFGMRAKGARFEVLTLFDLAACIAAAEGDAETARRMYEYALGTVDEMPPTYRGLLAATYICPQMFRHQALWSNAKAAELINTLSPAQGGAYPENLLNRTLYLMLTSDQRARMDVQRYAGVLARLPLALDEKLGEGPGDYEAHTQALGRLYPSLIEKAFPVLHAMPYMLKALERFNMREEDIVR